MTVFTVHVPRDPVEFRELAEKIEIVPEAFSWGAFVFGPLWLIWNRLWFALMLWIVAIVLIWLFGAGRFSPFVLLGFGLLVEYLLGLEANGILASGLSARGLFLADVVMAGRADAAERIYLQRAMRIRPEAAAAAKAAPAGMPGRDEFIGLSPDSGG